MLRSLPHRLPPRLVPLLLVALALAPRASALERTAERVGPLDRPDEWNTGTTCSVAYYNICTGYIWVWSGLQDGELYGTVFERCCPAAVLDGSYLYFRTGAAPGWGFTGTVSVYAVADGDCMLGPPLASQLVLPASGWNFSTWWGLSVPPRFAIVHGISDEMGLGTCTTLATDGPFACGVCYPTTRTTSSYRYGTVTSPLCPPDPMFDGDCYVEFLAAALMTCPVTVEDESWGRMKGLYR